MFIKRLQRYVEQAMPLEQFHKMGGFDPNKDSTKGFEFQANPPPGFNNYDLKLVDSPNYYPRLQRAFSRSHYKINIIFYNGISMPGGVPEISKKRVAIRQLDYIKRHNPEIYIRIKNINSQDSITFIINSNGVKQHPMTPWMVAHNLYHAMETDRGPILQKIAEIEKLMNIVYYFASQYKINIRKIVDFKSAQHGSTTTYIRDLEAELFAQWIITNDIKWHISSDIFLNIKNIPDQQQEYIINRLVTIKPELLSLFNDAIKYYKGKFLFI